MNAILAALRAMAEPTRLRLLALCATSELTVSELVRVLGQSQPRVSRHLRLMAEAGLLDRCREGSWVFHRLAADGAAAEAARRMLALLPADEGVLGLDRARLEDVRDLRARRAADYFRRNAAHWNSVRSLYVDETEVERVLLHLLPADGIGALLDIGTGTGRMLEIFAPRVGRAVGIDLSSEMLAIARANLERAALSNCSLRKADMYRLPFADGSFDAVTIHQVLHFADDPDRAVAEAGRVLGPGGHLLVADFAPHRLESLRVEHAHRRLGFHDAQMEAWFAAARLETDRVEHLPGRPLTVTVWLAHKAPTPARQRSRPESAYA